VFGQKYESSPTTQSAQDYGDVTRWIESGAVPESIMNFHFDPYTLRETTIRQRAVYRGTLALILRRGTKDFHSHETLTLEVINQNHVEDHHIFPNKFLERKGVEARLRDSVLNHTLIDRDTNIRISDRAPSAYMQEILQARGEQKFCELLCSHLLPFDDNNGLLNDSFEEFLTWRQEKTWDEIKKVTGLSIKEKVS
jgi:hypothetical protein